VSEYGGSAELEHPNIPTPADGALAFTALRWPSGRELLSEARRVLVPGGELLVAGVGRRSRADALTALTAAGFTPYWCDGSRVTARRVGG
jgi:hypothetical protein